MARTPSQMLAEARDLWADDASFDAARSLLVREVEPWGTWSDLSAAEQRRVAERLLERAIGRQRGRMLRAA